MNRSAWWFRVMLVLLSLVLAACGSTGTDSAGTAAQSVYVDSTVEGYGSIVVNGVHFDDVSAAVTLDDVATTSSALKLGMTVQVSGTQLGSSGTATSFVANAAIAGPVGVVDSAASSFTVYGVTVITSSQTIFDGVSDLSVLQPGSLVVAYGEVDYGSGMISATRVEVRPASAMGVFVDSGVATSVTATTFQLGGLTVNYSGATLFGFPGASVTEGAKVVVRASAAPVGSVLAASSVRLYDKASLPTGTAISAKGLVHAYVSGSSFMVNRVAVDASAAQFVNGTLADLRNGKLVQVQGTAQGDILLATKVSFVAPVPVTLRGPVTDFISAESFRVRGVPVDASNAAFVNGVAGDITSGRVVQITGSWSQGRLTATAVTYLDTQGTVTVMAGTIDSITSPFSFKVKGVTVVTSAATVYENGTSADTQANAYVVLYGPVVNTRLLAAVVVYVPAVTAPHTVYGLVSDVSGSGAGLTFRLNGAPAALDPAAVVTGGSTADIQDGSIVHVTGSLQSGTFVITRMALLTTAQQLAEQACTGYALSGPVYDYVSVSSFSLYGFSVDASAAQFVNGTASDLENGKLLRVCGQGSATGTRLQPLRVEFL